MLKLPSIAPAWADLGQGVRVYHRPASSTEVTAATAWARAQTAEMAERLPNFKPSDTDLSNLRWGLATIALGRLCVTAWEGVEGECTPDGVAALMTIPDFASAYLPIALGVEQAVSAEGNGCAPAPNGDTAGALNTAEAAGRQD